MAATANVFTPFKDIAQIAYVTTDYEQAIRHFAENFGVSEWMPLPDMEIQVGQNSFCRSNVGLAYVGSTQLEIVQPIAGDDDIYRLGLPNDGFGMKFHHVAQTFDTEAELDAAEHAARAANIPIAIQGAFPGGLARYFYTDHRDTIGHFIEHIWYAPEAQALFEHIPRN